MYKCGFGKNYLVCDLEASVLKVTYLKPENIVVLAKKVGLDEVELEDAQELLDSHKELLPHHLLGLKVQKEYDEAENK